MKVELKNVEMCIPQNMDSIKFSAELYISDQHAGFASDDGTNTGCVYSASSFQGEQLIYEAELHFIAQPAMSYAGPNEEPKWLELNLEYHIRKLAHDYYCQKELHRLKFKNIVFTQDGVPHTIPLKYPVSAYLGNPAGEAFLKKTLENHVIPLMKEGDVLLNTNFPNSVTEKLSESQLAKKSSRVIKPDKTGRSKRQ